MFPFKANAFSFVVNNNADAVKANCKKHIDSYQFLDSQGNIRWTGKIKKDTVVLQKLHVGGRTFYPVIIFNLEEIAGNATRITGYFCISLAKWVSLLIILVFWIYLSWHLSKSPSEILLFVGFFLVILFFFFLIGYFTFSSNHKMWVSELKMLIAADVSK